MYCAGFFIKYPSDGFERFASPIAFPQLRALFQRKNSPCTSPHLATTPSLASKNKRCVDRLKSPALSDFLSLKTTIRFSANCNYLAGIAEETTVFFGTAFFY